MTNTNLLKSVMANAGDLNFVQCLADLLHVSRSTASKKLNGKGEFSQSEIATFADRYSLEPGEVIKIFVGS